MSAFSKVHVPGQLACSAAPIRCGNEVPCLVYTYCYSALSGWWIRHDSGKFSTGRKEVFTLLPCLHHLNADKGIIVCIPKLVAR